ncbi:MAG: DUF1570 domain-containing protein [Planctomycetaceae bacterium]
MAPMLPALPSLVVLLLVAAGGAVARPAMAVAPEPPPTMPRARLDLRTGGTTSTVDAAIVVEAADGGMLLELDDQRYQLVPAGTVEARRPAPPREPAESPRACGQRVLAELPPGFALLTTRHYVVCFDTSRDYAQWCAALFERLHAAFGNFWSQAGLEIADPSRPLVVVIFADRAAYERHAAGDLGAAADRVVGYYNLMSNRVTTFDLTGTDGLAAGASRPGGAAAEIMASPAAAGLVSTLVHEATHQMAFNCGMHRRLAPVPLWVSEGIATYFETPDLAADRGWRGIGTPNRSRLDQFLAGYREGDIAAIVAADDRFRDADRPLDAYAAAWALTRHLTESRKGAFVGYLRGQAAKRPLAEDSAADRTREFEAAFGGSVAELEKDVVASAARLQSRLQRR